MLDNKRNIFVSSQGFTLIELIVVFGILLILFTFLLVAINPVAQIQKSNDTKRIADLSQIQRALETYYQDHAAYPASSNDYQISTNDVNDPKKEWGTAWQPYMDVLPKDAKSPRTYVYYSSGGQSYYLYASLEESSSNHFCNSGNACLSLSANGISNNACGATCNYGISSPNVSP